MSEHMSPKEWTQYVDENFDKPCKCAAGHDHEGWYDATMCNTYGPNWTEGGQERAVTNEPSRVGLDYEAIERAYMQRMVASDRPDGLGARGYAMVKAVLAALEKGWYDPDNDMIVWESKRRSPPDLPDGEENYPVVYGLPDDEDDGQE